jgi:hypothetical protein
MIKVSSAWRSNIGADTRKTITMVACELCPQIEGYPCGTASASSEYDAAHAAGQAIDGRIRDVAYTSTGYVPAQLQGVHPGWWSSGLSNGAGVLSTPEVLTIHYKASIHVKNYFVVGVASNYPTAFTLEVSADGVTWETISTETANTTPLWSLRESQYRTIAWARLTVTKISAVSSPVKVLQAGAVTTVVFELYDNDVMKFTEELGQPSNASPLALVSSNWIEFALSNEARLSDQDNTSSFFYGLLGRSFRLIPYIGVRTKPTKDFYYAGPGLPVYYWTTAAVEEYEFLPLGVYWNEASEQATDEMTSKFLGYDRLSKLKDLAPPILAALTDSTIYELFTLLFDGLDLDPGEYWIDTALDQPVPRGFFAGEIGSDFSGETVGECIQVLAEAGNCYVRCDRFGIIRVQSNFLNADPVDTLTDDDWVFRVQKRKDQQDTYDKVRMRYKEPVGLSDEVTLHESEVVIPPGGGAALEIEFADPVGIVTRVELADATANTDIDSFYPGAVRSMVTFANAGTGNDTCRLKVYGKKLKFFNTSLDKTNLDETVEEATKILKVSNWLIQSREVALEYAESLLQYCSELVTHYAIAERGDPAREVGDLIRLNDETNEIDKELQITKQVMTWDGTLSSEIDARVAIVRSEWVFLQPGHPCLEEVTEEKEEVSYYVGPAHCVEETV